MTQTSVKTIAIFGNGLAGLLCAAKLVEILPNEVELTYIEASTPTNLDIFYGTATTPSIYDFLLGLNISEPELLQQTNTSFSLGTRYKQWGPDRRNWTQSFHRPLPLFNGVDFHHYLTRLKQSDPDLSEIEPYIMAVQAAERGVFAHPPEGKNIPLADVEYGYHFLPDAWCKFITCHLVKTSINWIKADIGKIEQSEHTIHSVNLSNGEKIKADFIIDALGPASKLKTAATQFQPSGRTVKAICSLNETKPLQEVCRVLTGTQYGWQAETPTQNGTHRLTVFSPNSEDEAMTDHGATSMSPKTAELGRVEIPWVGNCLTLGHGAAILEPLSPAPILLLQKDIDRLAELIPVTTDMKIEGREYNRRFQSDYEHAELFSRAFFISTKNADSPYWQAAMKVSIPDKLRDKIRQFNSRGIHVQYDYEPFSTQDWAMQHFGMGRHPERYDTLADHIPVDQLKQRLLQMNTAVNMMAKKMPPHPVYMSGLLKYLKDKHG